MKNLEVKFSEKVKEMMNTYVTEREVPAFDSVDIYPVLMMYDGNLPIRRMSNGSGYMVTVYVKDVDGNYKVSEDNNSNYRSVNVMLTHEEVATLCANYNTTLALFNVALLEELEQGVSPLANLYVKRYTVGKKYSYMNDPKAEPRIKEAKHKGDTVVYAYALYNDQPFNVNARMMRNMQPHTVSAPTTPTISFGRELNGEL